MKQRPLMIIGAGGHGRVVADIAALSGYDQITFLDDADVPGMPVAGTVSQFQAFLDSHVFFVAIGSNTIRKKIYDTLQNAGAEIASLCHPNAVLGSNVKLGQGSVVMAGVVINNGADIGDGVILNTCCSVDHDCKVGSFSHISVGAHLAGTVSIGDEAFVGAGATLINNVKLCRGCVIGAGAVVTKNMTECGIYVGVPARLK